MADIFDYIAWRGDLKLMRARFNNIDNLILSRLAYVPLDGIVPSDGGSVPVAEAARQFCASDRGVLLKNDREFVEKLGECPRFACMKLSDYVNVIDDREEKQFSAVAVRMGDGSDFIAFRGTDDTFVGWKEDFNMAFMDVIPAQRDAVEYLNRIAAKSRRSLRVGGHSKGGNLAVYAAVFCDDECRARITDVYNNDGPGFASGMRTTDGYREIRGRLHTFVPQSSVIGMLLEHEESYNIVKSTQYGIMQHDLYSWQVERDDFVLLNTVTNTSRIVNGALRDWIAGIDAEQRARFADALYEILTATNVRTFTELTSSWLKNAGILLQSFKNTDDDTKRLLGEGLGILSRAAAKSIPTLLPSVLGKADA